MYSKLSLLLLFMLCGCQTIGDNVILEPDRRLADENHLMKSRILMLERENNMLNTLNIENNQKNKELSAEIERLEKELNMEKARYTAWKDIWEKQIANQLDKINILEKDSTEKIKKLLLLNRQLEDKYSAEIKGLHEKLILNDKAYNAEKSRNRKEFAEKEALLLKDSLELKTRLLESRKALLELEKLKLQSEEKDRKLSDDAKVIAELKSFAEECARELGRLKAEITALLARISELEKNTNSDKTPEIKEKTE